MAAVVSNLLVEVLGNDGGLYPARVLDASMNENQAAVVYLQSDEGAIRENWYPVDQNTIFLAPGFIPVEDLRGKLQPRTAVEVYYGASSEAPNAWYPGELVKQVAEGLYEVSMNGQLAGRLVNRTIEHIRVARRKIPVGQRTIRKVQMPVPTEASKEAASETHLKLFARLAGLEYLRYDPKDVLIAVTASDDAASRFTNLANHYIGYARERQSLKEKIASARLEIFGPQGGEVDNSTCRAEINYPGRYQLLRCLGNNMENLKAARAMSGIAGVAVDYNSSSVTIYAKDEVSLKDAREMLEYAKDHILIEERYVARIIGTKGENINEIRQSSGVATLSLVDDPEQAKRNGLAEWKEGFIPMFISGRRVEVDAAKMIIEYQLDVQRELEEKLGPRQPRRGPPQRRQSDQVAEDRTSPREAPSRSENSSNVNQENDQGARPRFGNRSGRQPSDNNDNRVNSENTRDVGGYREKFSSNHDGNYNNNRKSYQEERDRAYDGRGDGYQNKPFQRRNTGNRVPRISEPDEEGFVQINKKRGAGRNSGRESAELQERQQSALSTHETERVSR